MTCCAFQVISHRIYVDQLIKSVTPNTVKHQHGAAETRQQHSLKAKQGSGLEGKIKFFFNAIGELAKGIQKRYKKISLNCRFPKENRVIKKETPN